MPSRSIDLPQGTLDLLILRTLSLEPLHGWAVSERIQQISSDVLRVQQGSLYPALHRLDGRGWSLADSIRSRMSAARLAVSACLRRWCKTCITALAACFTHPRLQLALY